jgi:hypothetical protein
VIREMFPDWSEVDVLYALQETNGDENEAVTRIAEGTISQWDEVSKVKKAPRKTKETAPPSAANDATGAASRPARGGRIVSEGGRGRGRATDGGGRGGRGGRPAQAPATNGARKENQQLSVSTEESTAWGETTAKPTEPEAPTTAPEATKSSAPAAKTWASMLRQTAVKPQPKPKEPVPPPVQAAEPAPASEPTPAESEQVEAPEENTPVAEPAEPAPVAAVVEPDVALQPSKDELTETNLEQVVDVSIPPATATAASTAADSWDPRQNPTSTSATPLSASYQQHQGQTAPASGYAAAAIKATTDRTARVPSYQRRVLDQEEAVRMPGNREVDRAAVQFGAFNLNDGEDELDGEREEPETRAQPPAESPVAHPRASLPPVNQPAAVPDAFAQKQPGPAGAPSGPSASNTQFGRYGQSAPQDIPSAPKPQDPFSQQAPASQPPFDNFSTPTSQAQAQQPAGAFSSAPSEYSSYYTAGQHDRNPYNNYYGQQFGQQQGGQGQPDNAASQQRGFGGYNATQQADNLSQYPQSQPRLGSGAADAQNSGNNTPNPTSQAQQPQQQQQAGPGSQPQSHGQQYPGYNHPYYSNPYYHQYYSGYGQGSFGPYGGKGGMYGQPYGVSPNTPYDHASSPGAFNQSSAHRDSGLGSGLGDYGRGNAAQSGSQPGLGGSSSFGSMHDSFARGSSAFQSQTPSSFSGQNQPGSNASTDELKPFPDSKTTSGPSPALGGARPGSAANNGPGAGLPPPQGSQMGAGYGGYPGHLQSHGLHGNSGYGMGAGAGGNQHGNTPYGSYGNQGFGSGGYYGAGQQQRGWGGNYH